MLVSKLVAESGSADMLARVYPQQLVAADAHIACQDFVNGFNDATYSGSPSAGAVEASRTHMPYRTSCRRPGARGAGAGGVAAGAGHQAGGTTSAEPLLGEKPEIAALAKDNQDTRLRFQQGTAQTRAQARLNSLSGDKL